MSPLLGAGTFHKGALKYEFLESVQLGDIIVRNEPHFRKSINIVIEIKKVCERWPYDHDHSACKDDNRILFRTFEDDGCVAKYIYPIDSIVTLLVTR